MVPRLEEELGAAHPVEVGDAESNVIFVGRIVREACRPLVHEKLDGAYEAKIAPAALGLGVLSSSR